jgi:RND family efflux transporter MFP subunit
MGFEVAGRVTKFVVQEGDRVAETELLAQLDPRDYEAELKVAFANLAKAKADLARNLKVQERAPGAVTEQEIEVNKRAVAVSEAQYEIAEKAVKDTELRAPFDGVMARKLVDDFANVQAKESVLIFQDDSELEIDVALPERDVVRRTGIEETKEQMSARLRPKVIVSALPDVTFDAKIKEFAMTANPETRTFSVKLTFENPAMQEDPAQTQFNVLPGMTARVRIVVDPESAWSIPATAAQANESGQPYVWKVDPEKMTVSRSAVKLGPLRNKQNVLLKGGVDEGDRIAISGVTSLREGMKVREFSDGKGLEGR